MKRILFFNSTEQNLYDGDDFRPERGQLLINSLLDSGYPITHITSSFNHSLKATRERGKRPLRVCDRYTLIALAAPAYKKNISIMRIINHCILGIKLFGYLVRARGKYDVAIVSFPPIETAFAAALVAKLFNKTLIVDFRDRWPELIEENISGSFIRLLLVPYYWMRNFSLRQCRVLTSTSTAFLENAVTAAQVPSSVDFVELKMAYPRRCEDEDEMHDDHVFTLVFAGSFQEQKVIKIRELVEGFMEYSNESVRLVMIGDGPCRADVIEISKEDKRIIFPGWLGAAELSRWMNRADAGILPYAPDSHFLYSFPNKFVEYLSFGLPVITALTKGTAHDLLKEWDLGFSYNYNKAESLHFAIESILTCDVSSMEARARSVFDEQFESKSVNEAFISKLQKADIL